MNKGWELRFCEERIRGMKLGEFKPVWTEAESCQWISLLSKLHPILVNDIMNESRYLCSV